ncbi:Chromatin modification-related protein EAF3 [Saitozyma sp. JCM 24511]|uniref:Chromatin modification-related protein EAF3 n=1 Tax=Saitozyma podzolica TaxID=1890683 RepID=A0A427YVH4_9TREE|nr:Esa1p-associated factor [Saitozyma podzolica]GFZ47221.1 Chromatin modification-related protein EAF3 [Saitozyma sp. JCM 24511]
MATPMNQFMADEYVLAYHGPLLYEARILLAENWTEQNTLLGTTGPHYFIHYKGWKQTWDEWVPEGRLLKLNEAGFALRRKLLEAQTKKNRPSAPAVSTTATAAGASTSPAPGAKGKEKGGAKKETGSARKRARETANDTELDYMKRPEVKIVIPDPLKLQLVDDWENVTKNNQLVTLPRTPNVRELLEEYRQYVQSTKKDRSTRATALLSEIISGITLYFDKALGNNLLYRFERAQYVEQRRANPDKQMSEIYGAEHLLRLFVNFGPFIAYTNIDTESLNILREYINDIMKWMIKEQKRLFVKEYETTTTQYQNLSRT